MTHCNDAYMTHCNDAYMTHCNDAYMTHCNGAKYDSSAHFDSIHFPNQNNIQLNLYNCSLSEERIYHINHLVFI